MKSISNNSINTRISISSTESKKAKKIAKDLGMTFQGWLGRLVKQAIAESEEEETKNE